MPARVQDYWELIVGEDRQEPSSQSLGYEAQNGFVSRCGGRGQVLVPSIYRAVPMILITTSCPTADLIVDELHDG